MLYDFGANQAPPPPAPYCRFSLFRLWIGVSCGTAFYGRPFLCALPGLVSELTFAVELVDHAEAASSIRWGWVVGAGYGAHLRGGNMWRRVGPRVVVTHVSAYPRNHGCFSPRLTTPPHTHPSPSPPLIGRTMTQPPTGHGPCSAPEDPACRPPAHRDLQLQKNLEFTVYSFST